MGTELSYAREQTDREITKITVSFYNFAKRITKPVWNKKNTDNIHMVKCYGRSVGAVTGHVLGNLKTVVRF